MLTTHAGTRDRSGPSGQKTQSNPKYGNLHDLKGAGFFDLRGLIASVGVGNWLISGGNHIADSTVAKRLQKVVEKACDPQWEMAAALNEIREQRLYRADDPPFATHCKREHAFRRTRDCQWIDAAEVQKQIEIVYHGRQMPTEAN